MSERSSQRRSRSPEEYEDAAPRADLLGTAAWLAGWILLAVFLLVIFAAPLPFGSNRDWAWAPILMVLGVIGILCALGLGETAGFSVGEDERWPLLALVVCFLLFTFVGLLQMSTHAPAAGSAQFYQRAAALLGQAHAVVPSLSVDATRNTLLRCLACVLVFVIARALFRDPARARLLIYAFLLSAVVVMIYALLQQSMSGGCYVGSLLKKQGDYTNDRCLMSGTFANSNSFGCFAGMALAATLAWVFQEQRRRHRIILDDDGEEEDEGGAARLIRRLTGGTMVLAAMALLFLGLQLFSSSRAAFAVTVVVAIALVFLSMRGRWRSRAQVGRVMAMGVVLGVVVVVLAGGAMLRKVSLVSEGGQFNRTAIWRASIQAADASPWLGWGLGNFADIYAAYQPNEIRQANDKAHSTPLELYVEAGVLGAVPGLLMVLIAWGVCLWGALQRRRQRHLLVAAFTVPGIAILHSTVDFSLQIPAIAFIAAAFLGMGWAQTFHRTQTPQRSYREAFTDDEE